MINSCAKIEIINHFDNLINKVDIDIEHCLENCNDEEVLGELLKSSATDRKKFMNKKVSLNVEFRNANDNIWPESTKVLDYLYQIRMRTIEELRKAQQDSIEYYKSSISKSQLTETNSLDEFELKSLLFTDKFYFQVSLKQTAKRFWYFNLFTFATDFYMSSSDIDSLEKLINDEKEPFCRTSVFDQKIVLITLLYESFIRNLSNYFPNQLIHVHKQDVSNIKRIRFDYDYSGIQLAANSMAIDLSRLALLYLEINNDLSIRRESCEITIEGLSSLKHLRLSIKSEEINFSLRNLTSLKFFDLSTHKIDEHLVTCIFDQLPNIEKLTLHGRLRYFNVDNFTNLKIFWIGGRICDDFNFELFKNICFQLEKLAMIFYNEIDYKTLVKLFNGHKFPNLISLDLDCCNMKRVKREFIDQFPTLLELRMTKCNIKTIEKNAFSNLKKLILLDLSEIWIWIWKNLS